MISGHGTGTRANDRVEAKISDLLCARQGTDAHGESPTFSSKGLYGHSFGASAALESVELLGALRQDLAIDKLAFLRPVARHRISNPWIGLKNSFAMGGLNTSLVISSDPLISSTATRRPQIRAIGSTTDQSMQFEDTIGGATRQLTVGVADFESFTADQARAKRSRWHRFDVLTQLTATLAAGLLVVGKADSLLDRTDIGLFVATERGPAQSWNTATRALQEGGQLDADIIPNLSRHALVANVAELLGLRGPTTAFYVRSKDGREVLESAAAAVETGCAAAVLAIEVDESVQNNKKSVAGSEDQWARGCFIVADNVVGQDGASYRFDLTMDLGSMCREILSPVGPD